MSEILRSLLQILVALLILRVIYLIAVPRRIRVVFGRIFGESINLLCDFMGVVLDTIVYTFNFFKSINVKDTTETISEVAATSVEEDVKDITMEQEEVTMDEYEKSMDDTYNLIVETFDSFKSKKKNNSKNDVKKA